MDARAPVVRRERTAAVGQTVTREDERPSWCSRSERRSASSAYCSNSKITALLCFEVLPLLSPCFRF